MKPKKIKELLRIRIFSIIEKEYQTKKGIFKRTVINHPGSVAILPFVDKERIILLKQFRHSIDDFVYEIPAGTLEPGESRLLCAKRELEEETGYNAKKIQKMGSIYLAAGYSTELMTIYIASELYRGNFHPEKYEDIKLLILSLSKVMDLVKNNTIKDSKTIIALFYYLTRQTSVGNADTAIGK